MERGAPHLSDMMKSGIDNYLKALAAMAEPRTMYVPDTELVGLVVTRIQAARGGYTIDHTQHLNSLQKHWGADLIKPYIKQGTGVSEALASSYPVYNRHKTQNIGGRRIDIQYIDLVEEIKQRVDTL